MKNSVFITILCLACYGLQAQSLTAIRAHSHNDYKQPRPFVLAYQAGAGSIEADVFLLNGKLYVAHEREEIKKNRTLKSLYIKPLARLFRKNGGMPYADSTLRLQLVIDIKEDYIHVIPELIKELKPYRDVFNNPANPRAVNIVLSGDMPPPPLFAAYPSYIYFDGRPNIPYTADELLHIAMISDDVHHYTKWNAQTSLPAADSLKLRRLVEAAHSYHKPFRFWATPDSPEAWAVLEQLGADWINTDYPAALHTYLAKTGQK